MSEHRIVSLLPSATEIVAAVGCLDQLVGRSHECDFPPAVATLPACCSPRVDPLASSRRINEQVFESLAQAVSIFEIDIGKLAELRPTLILTQDQCEVCAVSLAEVREALVQSVALEGDTIEIVSLAPGTTDEVWQSVLTVGEALGAGDRAAAVVEDLRARLSGLADAVVKRPPGKRPRVACIEWLDPLMVAGNWVPELVERAGGHDVLGTAGEHSPWISFDTLGRVDPDLLVLMPCGFDIERTRAETAAVSSLPEWRSLRAVIEGRVAVVDGHQFFNRPGPRLVESAEILAEIFSANHRDQADRQDFGHAGTGWQPL